MGARGRQIKSHEARLDGLDNMTTVHLDMPPSSSIQLAPTACVASNPTFRPCLAY